MNMFQQTSLMAAFVAGLLSFLSPCVLPLVPSYLSYITGLSFKQLTDAGEHSRQRRTLLLNSLLFIAGFSSIFIAFGASASFIGQLLTDYQTVIRKVGAVLIVSFGLYLIGLLRLKFLMAERRIHLNARPAGYIGSFLVGATFAAGWTPCVGPVLGTMLLYAGTADTLMDGVTLLAFYSLGLGAPLFLASLGVNRFLRCFQQVRAYLGIVSFVCGVLLILFGLLIYTDSLALLTSFFERHGIGWYVGPDAGAEISFMNPERRGSALW